jgi:sulfoquinovose isomerase
MDAYLEQLLQWAARSRTSDGFGWLLDNGSVDAGRPSELWISMRMTHVFALATAGGDDRWSELLEHGHHALNATFADQANGGWLPTAAHDGSGWSKRLYDHAFVLLAASSLLAVGVPGAQATYGAGLDAIDRHFWEDGSGAARDAMAADWRETEPYRGANANMHLVEALLAAGDVGGDRECFARALRISERIIGKGARAYHWRVPEHYDPDWQVLPEFNSDRPRDPFRPYGVTPGHGLEWARLLLHLEVALGAEAPAWLAPAAAHLADRAFADGWGEPGGIAYTTDWAGAPVVADRFHWVMCEAIATTHTLALRTADALWADRHEQCLTHTLARHVAPNGSWHHELDSETLAPTHRTWTGRPDIYHAYQALLLPSLDLGASVMGAVQAANAVT